MNTSTKTTPEGDVATVKRTRGRVGRPAILVGHSYGGSVITAAGTDDRVAGLVYIAALAPDADETSQSQQEKFPVTDVFQYVEAADGRIWMRPEGVVCFPGDLSEQEQKAVGATHYAPAADLFSRNAPGTAWKLKPSWYIVANNDRTVQPELQRFLRSVWVQPPTLSTAATSRCCPTRTWSSTLSVRPQKRAKAHPLRREARRGDYRDSERLLTVSMVLRNKFQKLRSANGPATRLQFRGLDGRLCVHAAGWNGKRSPRRLFSLSRDQEALENRSRKEKRKREKGRG